MIISGPAAAPLLYHRRRVAVRGVMPNYDFAGALARPVNTDRFFAASSTARSGIRSRYTPSLSLHPRRSIRGWVSAIRSCFRGAGVRYPPVCPVLPLGSPLFEGSIMTVADQTTSRAPTRRRHRWVNPAGFVWALGVLLWVLVDGLLTPSDQAPIIGLAIVLTLLGLIGAAAMSRELDILTALARLKLGPWMAIGFSLTFGLATLVWLGDVKSYHGIVTRSSLVPAGAIAGAGFIALILAYQSTPRLLREWGGKLDRQLRGGGTFSARALSVWALWAVSMLAWAMGFVRGNVGYLADPAAALSISSSANAVLATLTQLGLLATLVAAWRFAVNRRLGSFVLMTWIAGSEIAVGLFSGMKEAAIIHLVALVVGYSARGRLRLGSLAAAGVVVLFIITPFITAYRPAVLTGSGRLSPAQALQSVRFDQLIGGLTSGNATQTPVGDASARWSRIGDVAIIVGQTPFPIEYISAAELISGPFLGFVPRSVWPGKPVLDAGYQVNQQYYAMPASVYSSAAVTPYGDLYRHGGVGIVVIGMAILGMFVRIVDDRGGAGSDIDPRLLFLPMLLFTTMVKQEMDYLALSASLVSVTLAAALAARLVSRRKMPSP